MRKASQNPMAPGSPSPPPGPPANKRGAREAGKVRWRRRRRRGSRRAASGDGLKASGRGGGGFGGGLPVTPRVYFIWRRRATRRGWGRGDGEERAPRPRARRGSGPAAAMRRGERGGREGRYYWRPPRQSYCIAWALVIGRLTTSAVPFRYTLPWPTGLQLMGGLISCTVLTCFLGSSFDG